jgi:hypothetical protein
MADEPSYITQEALNAALKETRERNEARLKTLRDELTGEIGKVSGAVLESLKTGLPELLKPLLPAPVEKKQGEGEGAGGEGDGDKPKGPFAARIAEMEKALRAEKERNDKLAAERDAEKKEREAEKIRMRQQTVEQRKDSARSKIVAALASDKRVRDSDKAEALLLKMERDGNLKFDEQGNAVMSFKRSRFQGEAPEAKDFDLGQAESLDAALDDWALTENAKKWLPAAPLDKKPPTNTPPPRRQPSQPRDRATEDPRRSGEDVSEDELLARVEERLGGGEAVRDLLTNQ